MNKNNNKSGSMLTLVALGILVVGGIVPFLIENTETNRALTGSIDETNKQVWTLQSAVHEAALNNKNNAPGLKTLTNHKFEASPINFVYGNQETGFKPEAHVVEYNSHLNKNQSYLGHIHDKTGYDLSAIQYNEVKPGTTVINNTTYVWDKYGKLYELSQSKLVLKPISGKVWQVVSDGINPVVLTTDLKAINITDNKEYGSNYYQFAAQSDSLQAAINTDNNLFIPGHKNAANRLSNSSIVEDIEVSKDHGLILVNAKDAENKEVWEVWGWGNNASKQLICTSKDSANLDKKDEYSPDELVKISDIFSKCKASGNVSASVDIDPFKDRELSENHDSIFIYFQDYYGATQNSNGQWEFPNYINPDTGKPYVHDTNKKSGKGNTVCDCPFCKDVGDPYIGKPSDQLPIPMTLFEEDDREMHHLEVMVDPTSTSFPLSTSTTFRCLLTNDATGKNYTFEGGKINPNEKFDLIEKIKIVQWDKSQFIDPDTGKNYLFPAGKYSVKFYATARNGKKYQTLNADNLFWGWKNRDSSNPNQSMGGKITEDNVYGGVFRLNHKIYNLNGGNASYGYNVDFYAIAAGKNFSLAVVSPQGWTSESDKPEFSVIGWGSNEYGQLGNNKISTTTDKCEEMLIASLSAAIVKDYRDMQAGENHALFLTKSGKVYSWGGSNSVSAIYNIHQVTFENNPKIIYIAAGNDCSSALDENGNLYSWSIIQGQNGSIVKPISNIDNSMFSIQ